MGLPVPPLNLWTSSPEVKCPAEFSSDYSHVRLINCTVKCLIVPDSGVKVLLR